jgi:hypothetical protein
MIKISRRNVDNCFDTCRRYDMDVQSYLKKNEGQISENSHGYTQ